VKRGLPVWDERGILSPDRLMAMSQKLSKSTVVLLFCSLLTISITIFYFYDQFQVSDFSAPGKTCHDQQEYNAAGGFTQVKSSPKFKELLYNNVVFIDAFVRNSSSSTVWILAGNRRTFNTKNHAKCGICLRITENNSLTCFNGFIAEFVNIPVDHHDRPYTSVWVICQFPKEVKFTPDNIRTAAITLISRDFSGNLFDVLVRQSENFFSVRWAERKPPLKSPEDKVLTICTGPHYGFRLSDYDVLEWLEYQFYMGASIIRVYVTKNLPESYIDIYTKFSKTLSKNQRIELIEWHAISGNGMHYRYIFT
jgi:hypothetical protein